MVKIISRDMTPEERKKMQSVVFVPFKFGHQSEGSDGVKITNRRLLDADGAFSKLLGTPLDFKLAYRIRKIAKKIMAEFKSIEEFRQELFKKYGDKQENGSLKVPEAKAEAFKKEFDAILDIETEVALEKIPFECVEGLKISAYELSLIDEFIEEPKQMDSTISVSNEMPSKKKTTKSKKKK